MRIAVAREIDPVKTRVAATPETVKKLKASAPRSRSRPGPAPPGIPDADFEAAGATLYRGRGHEDADIVLKVRRPTQSNSTATRRARWSSPSWTPMATTPRSRRWPTPDVTAFAMEFMPRITRAQVDGRAVVARPTSPATRR